MQLVLFQEIAQMQTWYIIYIYRFAGLKKCSLVFTHGQNFALLLQVTTLIYWNWSYGGHILGNLTFDLNLGSRCSGGLTLLGRGVTACAPDDALVWDSTARRICENKMLAGSG